MHEIAQPPAPLEPHPIRNVTSERSAPKPAAVQPSGDEAGESMHGIAQDGQMPAELFVAAAGGHGVGDQGRCAPALLRSGFDDRQRERNIELEALHVALRQGYDEKDNPARSKGPDAQAARFARAQRALSANTEDIDTLNERLAGRESVDAADLRRLAAAATTAVISGTRTASGLRSPCSSSSMTHPSRRARCR